MEGVDVKLGERTETLRSTLRAAKAVNAIGGTGGYAEVFRRLSVFDLDAYVGVIAAGLNKRPAEVEEAVFAEGIDTLADPLARFVGLLARGGKAESETANEEGASEGNAR